MSDDIWGEFSRADDRWKPETPGDSIVGTVTSVRIATMPDGTRIPAMTISTDDGERDLLAGQVRLQAELAKARPRVGDRIAITFTGLGEAKPGKSAPKLFEVAVKQGAAAPAASSAADQL